MFTLSQKNDLNGLGNFHKSLTETKSPSQNGFNNNKLEETEEHTNFKQLLNILNNKLYSAPRITQNDISSNLTEVPDNFPQFVKLQNIGKVDHKMWESYIQFEELPKGSPSLATNSVMKIGFTENFGNKAYTHQFPDIKGALVNKNGIAENTSSASKRQHSQDKIPVINKKGIYAQAGADNQKFLMGMDLSVLKAQNSDTLQNIQNIASQNITSLNHQNDKSNIADPMISKNLNSFQNNIAKSHDFRVNQTVLNENSGNNFETNHSEEINGKSSLQNIKKLTGNRISNSNFRMTEVEKFDSQVHIKHDPNKISQLAEAKHSIKNQKNSTVKNAVQQNAHFENEEMLSDKITSYKDIPNSSKSDLQPLNTENEVKKQEHVMIQQKLYKGKINSATSLENFSQKSQNNSSGNEGTSNGNSNLQMENKYVHESKVSEIDQKFRESILTQTFTNNSTGKSLFQNASFNGNQHTQMTFNMQEPMEMISEFAQKIQYAVKNQSQHISITIHPEHLGLIKIQLKMANDRMSGKVEVNSSDVHQLLTRHSQDLSAKLNELNIQLDNLEFTLENGNAQNRQDSSLKNSENQGQLENQGLLNQQSQFSETDDNINKHLKYNYSTFEYIA